MATRRGETSWRFPPNELVAQLEYCRSRSGAKWGRPNLPKRYDFSHPKRQRNFAEFAGERRTRCKICRISRAMVLRLRSGIAAVTREISATMSSMVSVGVGSFRGSCDSPNASTMDLISTKAESIVGRGSVAKQSATYTDVATQYGFFSANFANVVILSQLAVDRRRRTEGA